MSFSRWRSRSASASRPQTPVSSQAHLAATQAFLAQRASQSNLSASAAATALRTMSPQPVPVSQVQTKRMVQRQNSGSSTGSATRGRGRGNLQRQRSTSSMSERTFRSPSPGKPGSQPETSNIPPVPILAENYPTPPPVPARSQRRATSLDSTTKPTTIRPPSGTTGRTQVPKRVKDVSTPEKIAAQRSTSLQQRGQLERTDSKNSINFSYPRPMSPAVKPPQEVNGGKPLRSSMRSVTPVTDPDSLQYDAADQPVKKKTKKVARTATEGSHFQSGTMVGRSMAQPSDSTSVVHRGTWSQPAEPAQRKQKKTADLGEDADLPPSPPSTQTGSDSDSTPEKIRERRAARASGALLKQPSVVREDWEGEQENPATDPGLDRILESSPVVTTAGTVQSKKPMTGANVSKKVDEPSTQNWAGAQLSPQPFQDVSPTPSAPVNVTEHPPNLHITGEKFHQRNVSASPSRATRFSDRLSSDMTSGEKHEPLPRSVSPAKPALKHANLAPDSSPVNPALPRVRGSSASPSEASDSPEGGLKRKKSARVSFDTDPEIVGTAAEPTSPDSLAIASPQNRAPAQRNWLGIGKGKQSAQEVTNTENESGDGMGPTPQLPIFGSVRPRNRHADALRTNESPQNESSAPLQQHSAISATSSEASSNSNPATMNTSVSSDHAIGAILAHNTEKSNGNAQKPKPATNMPLPPEVTSVEGSGYVSDTDSEPLEHRKTPVDVSAVSAVTPTKPETPTSESNTIPSFAVQPPTPAPGDQKPVDQWLVKLPGGFPISSEQLPNTIDSAETKLAPVELDSRPATGLGTEQPSTNRNADTDGLHNTISPQPIKSVGDGEGERSSDNESIYSDAAEDTADLEGDGMGFGSINAIVDSPTTSSFDRSKIAPESPIRQKAQNNRPEVLTRDSWDRPKAHWSGLAQQSRQSGSIPSSPSPAQTTPSPTQQKRKKKGALAATAIAASDRAVAPSSPVQTRSPVNRPQSVGAVNPRAGAASPTMRSTARTQAPNQPEPVIRQSMRSGGQFGRQSRSQGPPSTASPPISQPRAALQKKHIPSATPAVQTNRTQPVSAFEDDSDSESSFRKARKNRTSRDGQFTMRRSMRNEVATGPDRSRVLPGREGVRSLSPEDRRAIASPEESKPFRSTMRGSAAAGTATMRGSGSAGTPTMRGSGGSGVPTMRGPGAAGNRSLRNQSEPRKSKFWGTPKPPKSPPPTRYQQQSSPPTSRYTTAGNDKNINRYAFQSRFADSSDDDGDEPEPANLRPVRGIPKDKDAGDSTDLEDSSDDGKQVATTKPQPARLQIPPPQSPTSQAPSSPASVKKHRFFGRLRSKKVKNEANQPYSVTEDPREGNMSPSRTVTGQNKVTSSTAATSAPNDKPKSEERNKLGFRSASEREAVIEQTRARLEGQQESTEVTSPPKEKPKEEGRNKLGFRSNSEREAVIEQTTARSTTPLLKGTMRQRPQPGRVQSETWPLARKYSTDSDNRPQTSQGAVQRSVSFARYGEGNEKNSTANAVYGRGGKKKRFPWLRKTFGLDD